MEIQYQLTVEKYGDDTYQEGDLYIPNENPRAVICLLHGGFWKMPYGRDQLDGVARFLASRSFIVWNIGYRRVGYKGGGCPGTFEDSNCAVKHLRILARKYRQIDLSKIVIIGHSAGGHLGFLYATEQNRKTADYIKPNLMVGLAPILDLKKAHEERLGSNAVHHLMNGRLDENQGLFTIYSPVMNIPLGIEQLIIHGSNDEYVPISLSKEYVQNAIAKHDRVGLIEIEDGKHMDFVETESRAFAVLIKWLLERYS